MTDQDMPQWRRDLFAAITEQAPPPSGEVSTIEEDRQIRAGRHCRECGDVGAAVVIGTAFEATEVQGRYGQYFTAVFPGTLSDLLDDVADGALDVDWQRCTI